MIKKVVNINLNFKGYQWDDYDYPQCYGIYGIYKSKKNEEKKWTVGKLVYVGISDNLNRRIKEHSNSDYPSNGKYCYIYCETKEENARLAEAAIVNECKPEGNTDFIDEYPENYDHVKLKICGKHKDIPSNIEK